MKYFIGTDSGTQSSRVIIFDQNGKVVSKGSAKHPDLITEHQGWAEHDYDDCWNGFCEAAKMAMAGFDGDPADIVGIGFSSQRGVTYALDEDGNQLQRPISWMDKRMAFGIEDFYRPLDGFTRFLRFYSKANWTKVNRPEVFAKTRWWLTNGGYLGYKLTGEMVDTIANQNGGWPIDKAESRLAVEDWKYDCFGVRRDQMPKIFQPGELMARVNKEGAEASGLPEGIGLYACAGDKQGETLGAGCIHDGECYITFGTCTSLCLVMPEDKPAHDLSYLTYNACVPKQFNYEASLAKGYWLISWFRDNLGQDLAAEAKAKGCSIEQLLNDEAADVPPGCEGLVIWPDWQALSARPHGKGVMLGFDGRHKRKHMYRAMIEGISQQLKINTDVMCAGVGVEVKNIIAGGGGSLSPITMQATADIFNCPVSRTDTAETCSLGAAISAAVGSGFYKDYDDAVAHMVRVTDTFYPVPENVKLLGELREKVLKPMYPTLKPIFADLAELTDEK